ncbi:MAG: L,D-transpeptidase family protein [Gemmatimonadota bacterium]|nr:L,D-transpeptidase family protein [Gemmatimonadota bacterium]
MSFRVLYVPLVLTLALSVGCNRERPKYSPQSVARVLKVDSATLRAAIAARIGSEDRPAWVTPSRWQRVRATYQRFANSPLWLEEDGLQARATALLEAIHAAPEHALDTAAYPVTEIESVVNGKRLTDTASAGTIADADVLLTSAYVAYAADMLSGQVDPKTVSQAWYIPASAQEIDSAIVRGIEVPDMKASLAAMAPQDSSYNVLKAAYARYRRIAAAGGWPAIGATRDSAAAASLHARLAAEFETDSASPVARAGDTNVANGALENGHLKGPTADAHVSALVKQLQERYGLDPTGRLNDATLAALNVTAAERARQIGANLERHRWLPRYLGSRYIYVNVPSFVLTAYDSGRKAIEMKVVVGEEFEGKVTPVFSDSMETVVFRPYWNVTPDIQREEIAPKVARDPGYLARNNMEYWSDRGVRRIRQKPGEKNSLGLVKFLFPNDFNIYLHDTPAKALFDQTNRAASHGCIRVERPVELAEWALGWPAEKVQAWMHSERNNQSVKLPQKIPVYIVYFTVYLRDGQLYFGPDVYGRDEQLKEAVSSDSVGA